MSKKEKSFIQKIVFYIKEGLRQFANACVSFVGIMAEDYTPKSNLINTNISTKNAIQDLRLSLRMTNQCLRKTTKQCQRNSLYQKALHETQQSADFQASKRRLISRMKTVQDKINHINRQRSE